MPDLKRIDMLREIHKISYDILRLQNCSSEKLIFSGIVAFGVKESSAINNVFTTLNLAVVTYVIICGLWWGEL
jgi:hypothetical protein